MPSTSTTRTTIKKPNDGPCAACNKEGALFRCAPCRDAGVDVFFCNRDCQVRQWKIHKAVCKKASSTDPKKGQVGGNKEAKAEGKKEFQYRKNSQLCDRCLKSDVDIGSKLSMCSKCNSAYYCSRECQVEDWPRHKHQCKHNCEKAKSLESSLDSRGVNIKNLFQKWTTKATTPISAAAFYVLKRKGLEQQPPVKVVFVEVEFDYNAQTFVMAEVPRAMAIADLSQAQKEKIMEGWNHKNRSDQVYAQVAVVSTKELGKRFDTIFHIVLDDNILDSMNASDIDVYTIRHKCAQVRLKSDLFRGWKSIRRSNLQKQMNLGQSFTAFVQNALQFFCNKSLQNTHRIIANVKMGKDIGQISQLLDYNVLSIAQFKKSKESVGKFVIHVEDNESKSLQCTDMAIETLFVDFDTYFAFEYTVFCGVNVIRNKTAKQCKKAADKHFRKFQQLIKEMPSDLLEKVNL